MRDGKVIECILRFNSDVEEAINLKNDLVAENRIPPSSKNPSKTSIGCMPSDACQIPTMHCSTGLRAATYSCPTSGRGEGPCPMALR